MPGVGLALCGVGYDIADLQTFKHRPCATGMNKGKGKRAVSSFFEEGKEEDDDEHRDSEEYEDEKTCSKGKKGIRRELVYDLLIMCCNQDIETSALLSAAGCAVLSTIPAPESLKEEAVSLSDEKNLNLLAEELSSRGQDKQPLP